MRTRLGEFVIWSLVVTALFFEWVIALRIVR
jgi:hypothetical protein